MEGLRVQSTGKISLLLSGEASTRSGRGGDGGGEGIVDTASADVCWATVAASASVLSTTAMSAHIVSVIT